MPGPWWNASRRATSKRSRRSWAHLDVVNRSNFGQADANLGTHALSDGFEERNPTLDKHCQGSPCAFSVAEKPPIRCLAGYGTEVETITPGEGVRVGHKRPPVHHRRKDGRGTTLTFENGCGYSVSSDYADRAALIRRSTVADKSARISSSSGSSMNSA